MRNLLLALSATLLWASCDVNSYPLCLGCPDAGPPRDSSQPVIDGNGTVADAAVDASGIDDGAVPDACPLGEFEVCDGMDNDCDGNADEGALPGVGLPCSTGTGECIAGITSCTPTGEISCSGVEPVSELCDGLDNDCDGRSDEDIAAGMSCGLTDTGECQLGSQQCLSGGYQCVGAIYPTLEQCDPLDHDCDGNPLNGFNLDIDPQNCGMCGNVCQAPNAITQCDGSGSCVIALCSQGYWDLDGSYVDGCEYGPCTFQGTQEACNQSDDDCDGVVDESLVPPDICLTQGACGDPMPIQPTCTAGGWRCMYGPDVEVDGNGDLVPESLCDGTDNDCDGAIDEGHPAKDTPCDDGAQGICRATGTYICDPMAPAGPVICEITAPGQPGNPETCDNRDEDCDGNVDEGDVQTWVGVGGGVEMFAYEASRPDATGTQSGAVDARPCSEPGVQPWTNITQPAAEAACAAIGARLCTELEWQRACKVLPPPTGPIVQGGAPSFIAFIEAEDFVANVSQGGKQWVVDNSIGYSGSAGLRVLPNTGVFNNTGYETGSPRLDYQVSFNRTGTHFVWIRGWGANANDDSVHVGLDGVAVATADRISGFDDAWEWSRSTLDGPVSNVNVTTTGTHTINVWMREDGFRIDAILVTSDSNFVPSQSSSNGCEWSYGASCNTYAGGTCNGLDRDSDPGTAGDQNGPTSTGQLTSCFANWGGSNRVYDLSGNVKEWTASRTPGVNPQRGGSYTSGADGISCDYSFTVANDTFFFPNVGFRCCR